MSFPLPFDGDGETLPDPRPGEIERERLGPVSFAAGKSGEKYLLSEEFFSGVIPNVDLVGEMSFPTPPLKEICELVGEMVASRESERVGEGEWGFMGDRERL